MYRSLWYIRIHIVFCVFVPWIIIQAASALKDTCQERQDPLPAKRLCRKSCITDRDCISRRKSCQCDGICGLSCIKRNQECRPLGNIPHGRVVIKPDNKFGAVAQYSCDSGFKLSGVGARVCQGDENWSGSIPQCFVNNEVEKVGCTTPPNISNAMHDGIPGRTRYKFGIMVNYKCMDGYSISSDAVDKAWCVGVGISGWVGPNLTCTINDAGCPHLDNIQNGWVKQDDSNFNVMIARYYCEKGFFLIGSEQRKCLKNGNWDGEPPTCEEATCYSPPTIENSKHDGGKHEMYPPGYEVFYTCLDGYNGEGDSRAMCTEYGQWVGLTLLCTAKRCEAPGYIENGWRNGYEFTYQSQVTYDCYDGFELYGKSYQTCQMNGFWSGTLPTCEPVTCPPLFAPVHGKIYGRDVGYGAVIRFECDEGYMNIGSSERRCQSDKTWSGKTAKCEGAKDPCFSAPPHVLNGMRIYLGSNHGSKAKYKCYDGYRLHGMNSTYLTCEFGEWKGGRPRCEEFYCPNPGTIENGGVFKKVESGTFVFKSYMTHIVHGYRLVYECNRGYRVAGPGGATCVDGQWQPELSKTKCVVAKHPPFDKLWTPKSNLYSLL